MISCSLLVLVLDSYRYVSLLVILQVLLVLSYQLRIVFSLFSNGVYLEFSYSLLLEMVQLCVLGLLVLGYTIGLYVLVYQLENVTSFSCLVYVIVYQQYQFYVYYELQLLLVDRDSVCFRFLVVDLLLCLVSCVSYLVLVFSLDVVYSYVMFCIDVKIDSILGCLFSSGYSFYSIGQFYGECLELCGVNYSYMFIQLCVLFYVGYLQV